MPSERWAVETYRGRAEPITPVVQAALSGKRTVPRHTPFSEAWLAYALYCYDRPLLMEEVIGSADAINHAIPKPEEVAWAFLRLRKRGWLLVRGNLFGLKSEGRRAIDTIVGDTNIVEIERLEDWIGDHPLPGDV
jgi:hypothetical protein